MLSIFSIPKAFTGQTDVIQNNAIGSWKRLGADCDIILFGDDPGAADAAARYNARHEPNIERNEFGTPVLGELFARINTLSQQPFIAFVNADIILLDDFIPALKSIARSPARFMAVSSRFNCWIDHALTFEQGWDAALRKRARTENRMYPAAGSDIFVYPRGLFQAVPPFAIGRGYWDNWLMYEARRLGAELIDLTSAATAVHQIHPYDTVAGVPPDSSLDRHVYETKEGQLNLELAGGRGRLFTVFDATKVVTAQGQVQSTLAPHLLRRRIKAVVRRRVQMLLS
jgi:hypothetical protein